MKYHWLSLALLIFPIGCGEDGAFRLPDLAAASGDIGSYGFHFQKFQSFSDEALRELERKQNHVSAGDALRQVVRHLRRMSALTVEPYSGQLASFLPHFEKIRDEVQTRQWGPVTLSKLKEYTQQVVSRFSPDEVVLDPAMEGTQPVEVGTPAAPPKPEEEAAPSLPAPPPQAPPAEQVPAWVAFAAWERSHRLLLECVEAGQPANKLYSRLWESLDRLKKSLPQEQWGKLDKYREVYERTHQRTASYSTYVEGATKEDVLQELQIVGREMAVQLNPDK